MRARRMAMLLTGMLLLAGSLAANAQAPEGDPPPPPALAEPGTAAPASATPPADPELPPKIAGPDAPAPQVTIRTDADSGDVVEEYRQNGVVYMVRVRPQRGPAYLLLDTNGDGRLDATDGEGPVRPVYWTLYEWQ